MRKRTAQQVALTLLLVFVCYLLHGQDSTGYRLPPRVIQDVLTAPPPPFALSDAQGEKLLLIDYQLLSSVAELAKPSIGLAGLEIDPNTHALSQDGFTGTMRIRHLKENRLIDITGLPPGIRLSGPAWSPDNTKLAFCVHYADRIELWYADAFSGKAKRIKNIIVNKVFDNTFEWLSNEELLCRTVPEQGKAPVADTGKISPAIQENTGQEKPTRTYSDLLRNRDDAALFDYYARSQVVVTNLRGKQTKIGQPGVVYYSSPSPDGNYVLVETIRRPYSYSVRYNQFPRQVDVFSRRGRLIRTIANIPLLEAMALGKDAASPVARRHDWQSDRPATLYWIEAKDHGNPKEPATIRDELYTLDAPFNGVPALLHQCQDRFYSVVWGNDSVALVNERWWTDRRYSSYAVNPSDTNKSKKLFNYSLDDQYANPGTPATHANDYGRKVLALTSDNEIYLLGDGASPEGDQPFADLLDVTTGEKKRLWQSQPPYYEAVHTVLNADQRVLLTVRESPQEPPNYYLRNLAQNNRYPLTFYQHPYPQLKNIQKEEIRFTRSDSVELTAYFYLPSDYQRKDGRLPTLIWAYPVDYHSADHAGQRVGSPYRFDYLSALPPIALTTQGYAVVLTTMPVVGEHGSSPNDTYLPQIKANAEAVVAEGYRRGVVDTARVAVVGHSYGAFMVANLVTHTRLFKAGIALSGAYNRTLTPFGFQSEERTYWEVPRVYDKMSPFQSAEKMKTPLLLVHGGADNNAGTYPMQSERYFEALKGLGATVRYVNLPYESHTYLAAESINHVYWEVLSWINKYMKESVSTKVTSNY